MHLSMNYAVIKPTLASKHNCQTLCIYFNTAVREISMHDKYYVSKCTEFQHSNRNDCLTYSVQIWQNA